MKKSKLSETNILSMLDETSSGAKVDEVCRKYTFPIAEQISDLLA